MDADSDTRQLVANRSSGAFGTALPHISNYGSNEHISALGDETTVEIIDGQSNHRRSCASPSEDVLSHRRSSVRCPTCNGIGFVSKEQENQLVALIPLKDKRLKPRRTWLYVLGAVTFCSVAAFLLIFFMFPRDVGLSSDVKLLLPSNLTINVTEKYVNFYVTFPYNIWNSNYVPIKLNGYSLSVIFDNKVLNSTDGGTDDSVSLRDTKALNVKIGITFDEKNGFGAMAGLCSEPYTFLNRHYMFFQITLKYSFLGRNEEASYSSTTSVSCAEENS